uniref:Ribonuclease H-like domain-containing protein n=1 Tax=Tanacetum cinerariifolium TaxID=118510 RepID=A0A6L2KS45_TANCI|nr:ribonuclease H-like domain-containing protein [Tanacetum cinerariifolium]
MEREESSQPLQPPIASTEAPQMVSSVKLPILKKGEYILWTMKMEQYLAHTDYALWEVILNGIDDLDINNQYNNLKVYKADIKGSSGSSSNSQNVAFVSIESTNSTNELNVAYSVSTATGYSSQAQEDLEQINQDDLEEMDLKWQVAMLSMRVRDCRSTRNLGNISRDVGNAGYKGKNNGKRPAKEEDEQALVLCDRLGTYDWSYQVEEEAIDFALMAFTSNPSSSSTSNSKKEVIETVFDNRSSDEKNSVANDRFKKGKGYHAVPPLLTRNYMPLKLGLSFTGLDDSIYKFKISEIVTNLAKDEKDALETSTACVEKPKEDRSSAPLIEDWETDSDDDSVFTPEHIPAKIDLKNHQTKFAPTTVFTRSGRIPVSVAKPKAAASTSAAKPVNTAGPKKSVNFSRTRISVVKGNEVTTVKTSAGCVWRPRVNSIDQLFKDNRWICTHGHPQQALKNKGIVDSGCSRNMTGDKAYLAGYQEIHDGARTMLADSLLPVTFWAEAVNTACYALNRALVTKTHNKTPYELLNGRSPRLDFMRPFGCPVTILNTLDPLGKFEGKANEGFLVGYSITSTQDNVDAGKEVSDQHYIVLPLWSSISFTYKSLDDNPADDKPKDDTSSKTVEEPVNKEDPAYRDELDRLMRTFSAGGPSSPHPDAFIPANTLLHVDQDDSQIPDLKETVKLLFNSAYDDDLDIYTFLVQSVGAEANFNNIESSIIVSHIPTYKVPNI